MNVWFSLWSSNMRDQQNSWSNGAASLAAVFTRPIELMKTSWLSVLLIKPFILLVKSISWSQCTKHYIKLYFCIIYQNKLGQYNSESNFEIFILPLMFKGYNEWKAVSYFNFNPLLHISTLTLFLVHMNRIH